jgi:hypothetical protein
MVELKGNKYVVWPFIARGSLKKFNTTITLTSCFGLMTDSAVVDSDLVGAALRKSGLISN